MLPAATLTDALAVLRDEDRFEEHEDAEDILRSLGPEEEPYVPLLIRCLQTEGFAGRFWILDALVRIAPEHPDVFAAIAERSRDSDEQIRGEAVAFLGRYGFRNRKVAIPALARATRLRPSVDFVSNVVKAFAALVRLAGWKDAVLAIRRERGKSK